jgi:hypothetical protein
VCEFRGKEEEGFNAISYILCTFGSHKAREKEEEEGRTFSLSAAGLSSKCSRNFMKKKNTQRNQPASQSSQSARPHSKEGVRLKARRVEVCKLDDLFNYYIIYS